MRIHNKFHKKNKNFFNQGKYDFIINILIPILKKFYILDGLTIEWSKDTVLIYPMDDFYNNLRNTSKPRVSEDDLNKGIESWDNYINYIIESQQSEIYEKINEYNIVVM